MAQSSEDFWDDFWDTTLAITTFGTGNLIKETMKNKRFSIGFLWKFSK